MEPTIQLERLLPEERNQFVLDNQEAFQYGALVEFGRRDDHFEEGNQIIARSTIEQSLDAPGAEAYRIVFQGKAAGGVVIQIDRKNRRGDLDLLFVHPAWHSRGLGQAAWHQVEKRHPEIRVWECFTPYFETRNLHFYINKCGFHAVEFFGPFHQDPKLPMAEGQTGELFFRFEKRMEPARG